VSLGLCCARAGLALEVPLSAGLLRPKVLKAVSSFPQYLPSPPHRTLMVNIESEQRDKREEKASWKLGKSQGAQADATVCSMMTSIPSLPKGGELAQSDAGNFEGRLVSSATSGHPTCHSNALKRVRTSTSKTTKVRFTSLTLSNLNPK